ncbi:MAG TPA: ribonuclease Z [Candidatus Bathyarchaeia archaeon]|nr:ribonuclease Z [Candidatus Bathyarchaeia archaeon]
MSAFRIVFLGTSAAVPQKNRFLSSIAMQKENGEIFLFDCGEGTQYQFLKFNVNYQKITKIFFSHLHLDHILGIFGLLSTMRLMKRTRPLEIFGPIGTRRFFQGLLGNEENFGFDYTFDIQEVEEGLVIDDDEYRIIAKRVKHSVYCLAYAYLEKDRLGHFNPDKARKLKVKQGSKWSELQQGKSVLSEDNKIITPDMVLGSKRRGAKIVVAFDGFYEIDDFVPFALEADVLILEATYDDDQIENAVKKLHSTASISAEIAKAAKAKRLFLTHISPGYDKDTSLTEQAQKIFPEAIIAYDGLEITLNRKDIEE